MTTRVHALRPALSALAWSAFIAMLHVAPANAASLQIYVESSGTLAGPGTKQRPFNDVKAAVDYARTQLPNYSDVTIRVGIGTFTVGSRIDVDFPVAIRGSSALTFDGQGRPLAQPVSGTESRLTAGATLGANPLLFVHPSGTSATVSNVTLATMTIDGARAAATNTETVKVQKAQGFMLTDLIVRATNATTGIDVAASSGYVKRSYATGASACGICIAAGTAASPAVVQVNDNRSVSNVLGGLLLGGTAFPVNEPGDMLTAQINNNDFSQHLGPVGFGVRVLALGNIVPAGQTRGRVTAYLNGNTIASNRYGLVVDGGFPRRNTLPWPSTTCADTRTFTGTLDVQLNNNVVSATVARALLTFTRAQVFLVPATNPPEGWQYLHGATLAISDPGQNLGGIVPGDSSFVRYEYRETDPVVGGNCVATDSDAEMLNDVLTYNGTPPQYGKNF